MHLLGATRSARRLVGGLLAVSLVSLLPVGSPLPRGFCRRGQPQLHRLGPQPGVGRESISGDRPRTGQCGGRPARRPRHAGHRSGAQPRRDNPDLRDGTAVSTNASGNAQFTGCTIKVPGSGFQLRALRLGSDYGPVRQLRRTGRPARSSCVLGVSERHDSPRPDPATGRPRGRRRRQRGAQRHPHDHTVHERACVHADVHGRALTSGRQRRRDVCRLSADDIRQWLSPDRQRRRRRPARGHRWCVRRRGRVRDRPPLLLGRRAPLRSQRAGDHGRRDLPRPAGGPCRRRSRQHHRHRRQHPGSPSRSRPARPRRAVPER